MTSFYDPIKTAESVISRHPGENRGPGGIKVIDNPGFRLLPE
jgi:hypothetical protein